MTEEMGSSWRVEDEAGGGSAPRRLGSSGMGGTGTRKRSLAWILLEVAFLEELGGGGRRPARRRKEARGLG